MAVPDPPSASVWEWAHPVVATGGVRSPGMPWVLAGLLATGAVALGVLGGETTTMVVGLALAAGGLAFATRVRRRAERFRIRLTGDGTVEVLDGSRSRRLPLAGLTDVTVTATQGTPMAGRTLRLSRPEGIQRVRLPGGVGYLFGGPSLTAEHTGALVGAIRSAAGLAAPAPPGPVGSGPAHLPSGPGTSPTAGTVGDGGRITGAVWSWRYPDLAGVARRRRRVWTVVGGTAAAISAVAAVSTRSEGLGAMVLSATFVPGLILAVAAVYDRFQFLRTLRYRLWVDGSGTLRAGTVRRSSAVPLHGARDASVRLDTTTVHTQHARSTTRTWVLEVVPAEGKPWTTRLPSGGGFGLVDDTEAETVAQSVRHLAGLPSWWSPGSHGG